MSITDPAEAYFKQGLWAWDAVSGAFVRLAVDASGYLKVTGLTLAPGAATAAHQVTQTTALQLIDNLYNALHTVGTDELDVVIDGQTNDVEVVQQAPADLTASLHGYISSAWQKLPFLLGYSSIYQERVSDTNASVGTNTLSAATVPSGEVWVVTNVLGWNTDTQCAIINPGLHNGTRGYAIARDAGPVAYVGVGRQGRWVLEAGDNIECVFTGCTAGDNIFLDILGYKMDIDL